MSNVGYIPSCATDCGDETLIAVGNTSCPNSTNVELAEINELYLCEKSATVGVPTNPVLTYTAWGDNEAVLLTWKAAVDNTTAGSVRYLEGRGEIPQPSQTAITLGKGKIVNIGAKWVLQYTIDVVDFVTEQFMRKLMACKGEYHFWFSTDTRFYGGDNGTIGNIDNVYPTFSGGRGDSKKWIIEIGVNAEVTPVSDPKPW